MIHPSPYRYDRFQLRHMAADMRFSSTAPKAGDRVPPFDLVTLDGERLTWDSLDRPHLFVFGSNTCPMTASAAPGLIELYREFANEVSFVLVQVREAHPGEQLPQPHSLAQKLDYARRLEQRLHIPFQVAVDDIEGTFHDALDAKPNAAYLVDANGVIRFRSQWSRDTTGLHAALTSLTQGSPQARAQSTRTLLPLTGALGFVHPVVGIGGKQARRDLLVSAPPMAVMGRLAAIFSRTAPERRGLALLLSAVAVLLLFAAILGAVAFL